eukprot:scaffold1724_cov341-Pavlova_lutheri.AAC.44
MGAPRQAKRKGEDEVAAPEGGKRAKEVVGSGRKAAQGAVYRTRASRTGEKDDRIYVQEETTSASEKQALGETNLGDGIVDRTRRLSQLVVHDKQGQPQPIQSLDYANQELYFTAAIYPSKGGWNKDKGRKVACVGPIKCYKIGGMDVEDVEVRLCTALGEYICSKPATAYKVMHKDLLEQATLYHAVVRALSPRYGGNVSASFDELVSSLVRRHAVPGGVNATRLALANSYKFILNLLQQESKFFFGSAAGDLGELALICSLREEYGKQKGSMASLLPGITIHDGPGKEDEVKEDLNEFTMLDADEAFARRLQAKEEAVAYNGGRQGKAPSKQAYIKIDESEIADDYPAPQQYIKEQEEMDELLFFDEEMMDIDPEYLPKRVLSDFSVYNCEGLLSTLELLPMWGGVDPDVELFASGVVLDDDGEWTGIQAEGGSSSAVGSSDLKEENLERGTRMFLSQIKEWIVEFSYDALFISFRTDVAWYRLKTPNHRYTPWFDVVLKASRVAVKCISFISEEKRASKLSFKDVVLRLSKETHGESAFISTKASDIERYLIVHGQIILNQFRNYPVKAVRNAAFVSALKNHMELRKHCKLYLSPKRIGRMRGPRSLNPVRSMAARRKPMRATTTKLVHRVWSTYFNAQAGRSDKQENDEEPIREIEEDEMEEDDDATEENVLAEGGGEDELRRAEENLSPLRGKVSWQGGSISTHENGSKMFEKVCVGDVTFGVGSGVLLRLEQDENMEHSQRPAAVWLTRLYETSDGEKKLHGLVLRRGSETVLGEAANQMEMFLTWDYVDEPVSKVLGSIKINLLELPWGPDHRLANEEKYAHLLADFIAAQNEQQEVTYIFRKLYDPLCGAFRDLPLQGLGERSWCCPAEERKKMLDWNTGVHYQRENDFFRKDGVDYKVGSYVYLDPSLFEYDETVKVELPGYVKNGRLHKGGSQNLRAFGIGEILSIGRPTGKSLKPGNIRIRRFYRPEDVSREQQYRSRMWEVYWTREECTITTEELLGCCQIVPAGFSSGEDTFVCTHSYDPKTKTLSAPPTSILPPVKSSSGDKGKGALVADKGKGRMDGPHLNGKKESLSLATMDIFAGCGGLSEGMHQAGAAYARWAIEYEKPAADAFQLNNPEAVVFAQNCNVVLYKAMEMNGQQEECHAAEECKQEAEELPGEIAERLPRPGEVDFICGGPPCQGYSGMNRFNKGTWSKVQNEMVLAYLSFADFYRPRFWLLENVRNFVSFNKGQTFRLVIRSLLEMGYQVRFGVLNAANYGVAQSRKRAFIWACAPGEVMPEWPKPVHVFRSPQLTINLPGGLSYTAVPQVDGAPVRAVTVRDVIGDLPPIENGCDVEEVDYTRPPVSEFQALIRGNASTVRDHVCKLMNELNLERCKCIPKNTPGADWRELLRIVEEDPAREWFKGPGMREKQKLVPWCLPNTADRHNGWRGLYSRLDWDGHFPTATTDPNPMGKVGQVFHPEQDRIVSVRECARSQGFPDSFHLVGNVNMRHRQVGNAVPVPLARALGRQLLKALQEKQQRS